MTRTYEIVPSESGSTWRILSNGKPLRWYYGHRDFAEFTVRELQQKAERRAEREAWRKKNGYQRPPRDSKRQKVYAAERRAGVIGGPAFNASPEHMVQLCVEWARRAGLTPVVPVVRVTRRKRRGAHCWMNQIVLSPGSDLGTLVHEYAHAITWEERPAHGPRWAATYVALVRVVFNPTWPWMADKLEQEFRNIGLWPEENR